MAYSSGPQTEVSPEKSRQKAEAISKMAIFQVQAVSL